MPTVQSQPERLVLDATNMYWTNNGGTRVVVKAARDGSERMVLASFQANLFDLAVDPTHVYWASGRRHAVPTLLSLRHDDANREWRFKQLRCAEKKS